MVYVLIVCLALVSSSMLMTLEAVQRSRAGVAFYLFWVIVGVIVMCVMFHRIQTENKPPAPIPSYPTEGNYI